MLSCALLCWGTTAYAAFGDVALKYGMQGQDVIILQTKLNALGYSVDSIDGSFGSNTLQAVRAFQADNDMETDGIVGGQTFQQLNSTSSGPASYIVQSGDSLFSIAQQYNLYPSDIARMNNLNDPSKLQIGQVLMLPAGTPVSRGFSYNLRSQGAQISAMAQQFLQVPYAWGGSSPGGFDCSGFTYYLYQQQGINLPRMADEQYQVGQWVDKRALQPGDLVFFETYEVGPSHVGIYTGNGNFIHASSGAGEVTITPLSKPYYAARYLGARRVTH